MSHGRLRLHTQRGLEEVESCRKETWYEDATPAIVIPDQAAIKYPHCLN